MKAIGTLISWIVAVVYRTMTLGALRMATTAALLIIAVGACLLTRFLTLPGIGDAISTAILPNLGRPAIGRLA